MKFDEWPWKTIGHLFYATSSYVHHFVAIGEFKLESRSGNAQSGSNSMLFRALRPWKLINDLKKNREPLLFYCKLCAALGSHWWIQTGVKSPETPNLGQIRRFLEPCDLEIWQMTLKNNRAPLLSIIKPYASFHHHMWIQTGVTVQKRLRWVFTSVTLTFDFRPWHFAWTSHLSLVITPENFMMIQWWEHGEKGVTDGQTGGQTDGLNQSYRCLVAAKNNRAPLLSIIKLYASFHHHMWIQTGVRVRKRLFWVKFDDI